MPKEFYTERDIEDMVRRGILSLEVTDDVVLTDLAYEKANRLGMKLVRNKPDNPPAAPVRPYLSEARREKGVGSSGVPEYRSGTPAPGTTGDPAPRYPDTPLPAADGDLRQRIKRAVIARLGSQVDQKLLDVIITRVMNSTGVK